MTAISAKDLIKVIDPIDWVDGSKQPVKAITFAEQEILDDLEKGRITTREAFADLLPRILPGQSWANLRETFSAEAMGEFLKLASGQANAVREYIAALQGNGAAGETGRASAPATPAGTSSPELLEATAARSGT